METYNSKQYIEDYQITRDEFFLLPDAEKLVHVEKLYGYLFDALKHVGDVKTIRGYIPDWYKDLFFINGCNFENYDFGLEESEIKRINDSRYIQNESACESYEKHRRSIAFAKAGVFESIVKKFFQDKIDALQNGQDLSFSTLEFEHILRSVTDEAFSSDYLTKEEKDYIMEQEVTPFLEGFHHHSIRGVSKLLSQAYYEYLTSKGFVCESLDSENRKVLNISLK